MGKQALSSEPIDEDSIADLDRIADHLGCSREHLVATAVLRFVSEELHLLPDIRAEWAKLPPYVETDPLAIALNEAEDRAAEALEAYLKPGEDDINAGRTISQEEMERWFAERVEARKRPAAAE